MKNFVQGILHFRRSAWELVATIFIAAGVIMLMQPIALFLYTWSFIITLSGTLMFIIVAKFPE